MEHLANNESKELGSRRKAAFFYVNSFHFGNSSLFSCMALTQDDLNKLSIIVSEVIDNKLDEKFDPIIKQCDEIQSRLEKLYARIDKIMRKITVSLDNINSLIRKIRIP